MSQTSTWAVPTAPSGLAMRTTINTIVDVLRSNSSGASAPSPTVAGMLWFDEGVSPAVLRQRNAANTAWIRIIDTADIAASRTALGAGRDWTEVGPLNTSSGTAFDVTSIPEGVAEIEIMFDFVSLSGTDAVIVQLGALGDPLLETTGYQSARGSFSGTTIPSPGVIMDDVNPGFVLRLGAAGAALVGGMRLVRGASQTLWNYTAITGMDSATMQIGSGRKYMTGGRIDRFRVTRSGSNTFDNGFINVRYR